MYMKISNLPQRQDIRVTIYDKKGIRRSFSGFQSLFHYFTLTVMVTVLAAAL